MTTTTPTTPTTPTLKKIPRAEAVRRFKAATYATLTARAFRGVDTPNNSDGTPAVGVRSKIARVTSTGVYYYLTRWGDETPTETPAQYATTRFGDSPDEQWHESMDEDGNKTLTLIISRQHLSLVTLPNGTETPRFEQREETRLTYRLEAEQ